MAGVVKMFVNDLKKAGRELSTLAGAKPKRRRRRRKARKVASSRFESRRR